MYIGHLTLHCTRVVMYSIHTDRSKPAGTGLARPWDPLKRKNVLPVQMCPMEKFLHHGNEGNLNSQPEEGTCLWVIS